jgi:hypothetical protein
MGIILANIEIILIYCKPPMNLKSSKKIKSIIFIDEIKIQ